MVISNLKINSNMKLLLEKREKDYDKDKYGEIEEKDGLVEKRPKKEKKGGMGRGTGTGWEGKLGTDREIDMSKYKEDSSSINEDGTVQSDTSKVRK